MNEKFNILHVIPLLGCGGAEVLLGDIVQKQTELGNNVLICCLYDFHPSFDNYPKKKFLLENIEVKFINTRVVFSVLGSTKIIGDDFKQILTEFKPDVIHSHLFEAELISMSFILPNVRYVSHIHDNITQFKKFQFKDLFSKKRIGTLKERVWLFNRYSTSKPIFLSISKDVQDYLHQNLPASLLKNEELLSNCIDLKRFEAPETRKLNKINIVSVGNLVNKKNHILLIEIALILKENTDLDFSIDILGFGPLFNELKDKIQSEKLSQHVFLRGSVGNVNEYYRNANVYVHTATYEPFGLVLIEAMASGLPVISLDGKGNRDLIQSYENGILLTENKPEIFVDSILRIFKDEKLYTKLSENGKRFSLNFGIDNYVSKLMALYSL